ncbi:MAG TPA: hypothetical protein VI300_23930 [Solirubrobacter sp.]
MKALLTAGLCCFWKFDGTRTSPEYVSNVFRLSPPSGIGCGRAPSWTWPERAYYLWSGPLRSAMAFRHETNSPPSLIWPEDRTWFVGTPIDSSEIAIAGPSKLIDAVLDNTRLSTRRATPDDDLDIDD